MRCLPFIIANMYIDFCAVNGTKSRDFKGIGEIV